MSVRTLSIALAALACAAASPAWPASAQREAEVARRGADVMPFNLKATTHIFTKTPTGGTQRVIVKNPADAQQIALIRSHLRQLRTQFLQRDFSGPQHIHGHEMPGLATLEAAPAGALSIDEHDVEGGAELVYRADDPKLVQALHDWFDAQVSDHGADAMHGHHHQP
jgi:hypothetical protein